MALPGCSRVALWHVLWKRKDWLESKRFASECTSPAVRGAGSVVGLYLLMLPAWYLMVLDTLATLANEKPVGAGVHSCSLCNQMGHPTCWNIIQNVIVPIRVWVYYKLSSVLHTNTHRHFSGESLSQGLSGDEESSSRVDSVPSPLTGKEPIIKRQNSFLQS